MNELPALFISHGAPDLILTKEPAYQALVHIGQQWPAPEGIIAISAHWQAEEFTLGTAEQFSTIHDFGGFPADLYQLTYPAKGSRRLADQCGRALKSDGIAFTEDPQRGLDHGAWMPLMISWPQADIPILPLSLKRGASLREYLQLGRALAPLRHQGILLIASGAVTHNLGTMRAPGSPADPWSIEFAEWLRGKLETAQTGALLDYRKRARHARLAHPTTEHFDPLLIAYGSGEERPGIRLHQSFVYGNIAMDSYAF